MTLQTWKQIATFILLNMSRNKSNRYCSFASLGQENYRSSHQRCSLRKALPRNLAKSHSKTSVQGSLFLTKSQAWGLQLYQKETLALVFSCEICEISKNTFFTKHVWPTASKITSLFFNRSAFTCNGDEVVAGWKNFCLYLSFIPEWNV